MQLVFLVTSMFYIFKRSTAGIWYLKEDALADDNFVIIHVAVPLSHKMNNLSWRWFKRKDAILSQVTVSVRFTTHRNDLCDLHKPTYSAKALASLHIQTRIELAIAPTLILIAWLISFLKGRNKGLYWTAINFTLWRIGPLSISKHVKN